MSRLGRGFAALALAGAVTLASGPASQAGPGSEPSPRLSGKHLPTAAELAEIYPVLEGGHRYLFQASSFEANAAPDCVGIRGFGRPHRALWAIYTTAAEEEPYFLGEEGVTPEVHEFERKRDARRTMARLGSYLERCEGSHRAVDTVARLRALDGPALGDRSLAFQISFRFLVPGSGDVKRKDVHVVVRSGRRIVDAYLQAETFVPSLDNGVAVAELMLAQP